MSNPPPPTLAPNESATITVQVGPVSGVISRSATLLPAIVVANTALAILSHSWWVQLGAMATLILLRHGQSTWNRLGLFTGWVDVELDEHLPHRRASSLARTVAGLWLLGGGQGGTGT